MSGQKMNINGFTLIELVIVIVVIGILASLAVRSGFESAEDAKFESTLHEMESIGRAIVGDPDLYNSGKRTSFGYVGDVGALPSSLDDLVSGPGGFASWNGPYLTAAGTDDHKLDAWGQLYNYSGGVTLISSGSGSNITKSFGSAVADFTNNTVRGTILDAQNIPPGPVYKDSVIVTIRYPDGAGGTTSLSAFPDNSGAYSFAGLPIGNHTLSAVYVPANDTVTRIISVPPKSIVTANTKFGVALW